MRNNRVLRYFHGHTSLRQDLNRLPNQDIEKVKIVGGATEFLLREVDACDGSAYRSGPLFGWHQDEELVIPYAFPGGFWQKPAVQTGQIFRMDGSLTIGISMGLQAVSTQDVEWVGQWVASSNGEIGNEKERWDILYEAVGRGIVGHRNVLILVDKIGSKLNYQTMSWKDI